MKEYNWEERNIIRMPGEIALHTEDLHVTKPLRVLILNLKKIESPL